MLDQKHQDSKNLFTVESNEDIMKERTDKINSPTWDGIKYNFFLFQDHWEIS